MKNKLGDDFKLALTEVGAGFRERQLALAEHKSERQAKVNLVSHFSFRISTIDKLDIFHSRNLLRTTASAPTNPLVKSGCEIQA